MKQIQPDPINTPPEPVVAPRSERRRQVVLLAEDDPLDMHMYGMTLWYNGFDVLKATDGASAVALAKEHQPDLLLVDLLLPELNGIEVCRRIRDHGLDVPILALTARAEREFGELAMDAGCMDYLEKPISPLEVLRAVEVVVGQPPPPHDADAPPDEDGN